jgi:RNA polymerase sigma-70 factor (ECF subfamily)
VLTEHAFGEFYQRHARSVWTYVYRVTNHATDADDIVQEAFLRLFQADIAPSDDEGLRRYVFRIAGNLVADRWRRNVRDKQRAQEAMAEGSHPQPHDVDVARIFSELKPRERALLWLAYVEGGTHADIAESLRLARGSVRVLLSRARARLRDLLTARGVVERLRDDG